VSVKPAVLRERALQDIEEAADHYLNEAGAAAALGFIDVLEKSVRRLARHPAAGSSRYAHELDLPGLRTWPLRRYPYLIFYMEQDDHIDVWRVLHGQRDIPVWLAAHDSSPH
jgi:toxin ParE1/3/4